jgi:hypothetical protein
MSTRDQHEFYSGLRELAESAFPKRCKNCGRIYATPTEFIEATQPLSKNRSGLKSTHDDDGKVILELFRNCVCGSTLMDAFNDRRDNSPAGAQKRKRFSDLQDYLVRHGIEPERAAVELRKVAKGQPTDLLKEVAK